MHLHKRRAQELRFNSTALKGSDSCAAKKLLQHDVLTVESVEDILKSNSGPQALSSSLYPLKSTPRQVNTLNTNSRSPNSRVVEGRKYSSKPLEEKGSVLAGLLCSFLLIHVVEKWCFVCFCRAQMMSEIRTG